MKLRMITALAAATLVTTPLAAKPVASEVELHIEASASIPPDMVTVPFIIQGQGHTAGEAKADQARKEKQLIDGLTSLGIDPASAKPYSPLGTGGDEAVATSQDAIDARLAGCAAAGAMVDEPAPRPTRRKTKAGVPVPDDCEVEPLFTVTKGVTIELHDTSRLAQITSLGETESYGPNRLVFGQSDPAAARSKAREMAIAQAKADADGYAAAMGYRVVRIVRVSNARPAISMTDLFGFIGAIDKGPVTFQPGLFGATVSESVAIDFVMVPR